MQTIYSIEIKSWINRRQATQKNSSEYNLQSIWQASDTRVSTKLNNKRSQLYNSLLAPTAGHQYLHQTRDAVTQTNRVFVETAIIQELSREISYMNVYVTRGRQKSAGS